MTIEEKFQEILEKLEGVNERGDYAMAFCPAHPNNDSQSLSVLKFEDGVNFKCHGQNCATADICAAIGITTADLTVRKFKVVEGGKFGCTLQQYAEAKQIDEEWLVQALGLRELKRHPATEAPAVVVPYYSEDGEPVRIRYRTALRKQGKIDNRFRWKKGHKADTLYGLEQLQEFREDKRSIILVEGESDLHTLRYTGYAALGVPGAQNTQAINYELFKDIQEVTILREPGDAGATFVEQAGKILEKAAGTTVYVLDLPDGHDASSLYLEDTSAFNDKFEEAMQTRVSWETRADQERQQQQQELWNNCRELAHHQDILTEFAQDMRRLGMVGQDRETKIIYLAATSRVFDTPSSLAVKGPSSAGKSYTLNKVLEFVPEEGYYKLTAMSEKALAHFDKPLKHRHMVIAEATALNTENNDMASYFLRSLLSEGHLQYVYATATNDGIELREVYVEGPTGLFVTTTQGSLHAENETRLLSITVNDTRDQTRSVVNKIADKHRPEIDLTRWHALQRWMVLDGRIRVRIPYALWLSNAIPDEALHVRLRRDFTQLLNFIEAHALLHRQTRERDEDDYIVATCADYAVVRSLLYDIIAEGLEASVPKTVRATVITLRRLYDNLENKADGVTINMLKPELELERSVVQRRVQEAQRRGFVKNLEDKKGRPGRYIPADPLPDDVVVLPELEELVASGMCRCARCVAVPGGTPTPHFGQDQPKNRPQPPGRGVGGCGGGVTQPTHLHTTDVSNTTPDATDVTADPTENGHITHNTPQGPELPLTAADDPQGVQPPDKGTEELVRQSDERAERVRRLVDEGMSIEFARRAVYGDDSEGTEWLTD